MITKAFSDDPPRRQTPNAKSYGRTYRGTRAILLQELYHFLVPIIYRVRERLSKQDENQSKACPRIFTLKCVCSAKVRNFMSGREKDCFGIEVKLN